LQLFARFKKLMSDVVERYFGQSVPLQNGKVAGSNPDPLQSGIAQEKKRCTFFSSSTILNSAVEKSYFWRDGVRIPLCSKKTKQSHFSFRFLPVQFMRERQRWRAGWTVNPLPPGLTGSNPVSLTEIKKLNLKS
jgi:hypothetical protein